MIYDRYVGGYAYIMHPHVTSSRLRKVEMTRKMIGVSNRLCHDYSTISLDVFSDMTSTLSFVTYYYESLIPSLFCLVYNFSPHLKTYILSYLFLIILPFPSTILLFQLFPIYFHNSTSDI